MKKAATAVVEATQESTQTSAGVWTTPRYIVSKKSVDYDNLTAFEAVSMSAVFVLAVLVGVVNATIV